MPSAGDASNAHSGKRSHAITNPRATRYAASVATTVAAGVDETSALVMVIAAAVAAVIVLAVSPRLTIPVVVLELLLGILIGPQGLDIARIDPTTSLLGDLGLGMLFFFAGYEIDFDRIKGRPLELAAIGWGISLILAYGIGGAVSLAWAVAARLASLRGRAAVVSADADA